MFPNQNPYLQNYGYSQKVEVVKVHGEHGANAFQLPPNSSALLLDETAPLVWLVVTDGAGYKTATPYNITKAKTAQEAQTEQFNALMERMDRLEAALNAK